MSNKSNFSWEFACPKFVDFKDPNVLELNVDSVDSYFDAEHEFSFNNKLSEALKVESILAAAESMSSPGVTPSRPASSASNYRTPPDTCDLESDEVFYTTRKSYDLRDTECRRLKQIGASPYRIPGGTSTNKKKYRRPPFTPKFIEENAKQIEEEILVDNLKKVLFLDIEDKNSSKDLDCESTPINDNSAYGKENSAQSIVLPSDNLEEVLFLDGEEKDSPKDPECENEPIDGNSEKENSFQSTVPLSDNLEKVLDDEEKNSLKDPDCENIPINENSGKENSAQSSVTSDEPKNNVSAFEIPKICIAQSPIHSKSTSSPDEVIRKSNGGCNSDNCWTDVDDENAPTTSKTQEKRRRPLRRESFIKSSATLASTVKKADPQKRLYRLLSYTAPPKNKYRSLAELSKDFETKIRAYTPPNLRSTKAQWTPTKPVSPKLTACKRKRTLTCVSHKEQEESIAQSIKKNTFKATPFNKKTYMSTVNVGVKRVDPKPTTKPIPFSFRSEKRIEARRSKVPADLFNKLTSESAKKPRK